MILLSGVDLVDGTVSLHFLISASSAKCTGIMCLFGYCLFALTMNWMFFFVNLKA